MSVRGLLRAAFTQLWKLERTSSVICAATKWNSTLRLSRVYSSLYEVDDYVQLQRLAKEKLRETLASPSRFQSIDDREDRTDAPYDSDGKYISEYRGALLIKNPNDLSVYYQLFTHERPRAVLEMGTYSGASAIWYDDTAKSLDLDCHIYSVDIEPALLDEKLKKEKSDKVNFIIGDTTKIEDVFPPSMLEPLPHPWLIVEDSHNNTAAVVEYFHQFMKVGDYMIIEDTSPYTPYFGGDGFKNDIKSGSKKLDELKNLLRGPVGQNFKVDSFYTDLYGYNCTWHWHGFLRKCS